MRRLLGLAFVAVVSSGAACAGGSEAKSAAPAPAAAPAPPATAATAAPAAAPAAAPEDAKFVADLQGLCSIATEVLADKKIGVAEKPRRIAERLKALHPGPEFAQVLASLGALSADARLPALQRAAAAHGLAHFECPALVAENR